MAGIRLFLMNPGGVNHASCCLNDITYTQFRVKHFQSQAQHVHSSSRCYMRNTTISPFSQNCLKANTSMSLLSWNPAYPVSVSRVSRTYLGGPRESEVLVPSVANQSNVHSTNVGGSASFKKAPQSTEDASIYTREKTEEASNKLTAHIQQSLDTYPYLIKATIGDPYLINAIIPVIGTLLAWLVMSKVFTKVFEHYYSTNWKYFWDEFEDPVRYLVIFMAFSSIGSMIAPTTITFQNITEAWKATTVLSIIWFTHRLKTVFLSFFIDFRNITGLDRERLLALNKLSSVCLFTLGLMVLLEPCNLPFVRLCILGWRALNEKYKVGLLPFFVFNVIAGFTALDEGSRWKGGKVMVYVPTPKKKVEGHEGCACYYCGKPGHLTTSCLNMKRDLKRNKPGSWESKEIKNDDIYGCMQNGGRTHYSPDL